MSAHPAPRATRAIRAEMAGSSGLALGPNQSGKGGGEVEASIPVMAVNGPTSMIFQIVLLVLFLALAAFLLAAPDRHFRGDRRKLRIAGAVAFLIAAALGLRSG